MIESMNIRSVEKNVSKKAVLVKSSRTTGQGQEQAISNLRILGQSKERSDRVRRTVVVFLECSE